MRMHCPYCKRIVERLGLVYHWERVDKSGIFTFEEAEKEYHQLKCGHEIFIRDTGKRRGGIL
jgi:hypothetical protein